MTPLRERGGRKGTKKQLVHGFVPRPQPNAGDCRKFPQTLARGRCRNEIHLEDLLASAEGGHADRSAWIW